MFWYRMWRKIHRPLIVLSIIGFIVVTATHHEIKFEENDEHRNSGIGMSDKELLLRSVSYEKPNNDDSKYLGDIPGVPVSPVQQLPYCKGTSEHGQLKSGENDNSLGSDNSNSSDEIIISPGRLQLNGDPHIVVATLDGQLSLLDYDGRILWSVGTGQLFSSTISSLQLSENGKWIHLIPSLTGGLYKYDGDNLHPMPLNADSLLRRSFKLSNDVVMTGGKELRTYGIDLGSGSLRYECGIEGCPTPSTAESRPDSGVVLVVKKQLQTVRAIDSVSGSERWNFSVATHELALAGVTEGCYEPEQKEDQEHFLKVVIPEGLVIGAGRNKQSVWKHKFASPISQAWILENGRLKVIDPIKNSALLEESPALYIGIHKQQFYVQESHTTAEKLETAFAIQFSKQGSSRPPVEIAWKPSSAIEAIQNNKAVAMYQPPKFDGFYVFEKDELPSKLPAIENTAESTVDNESEDRKRYPPDESENVFGFAETIPIFASLWYWWKEVLGISLLTAIILNVLLMRPLVRVVRTQTVQEMLAFFGNLTNKQQDERALLPRRESDTLELPSARRNRTRTTSSSSSVSQIALMDDSSIPFVSQYLREFDPIQCLGRGGFGVVFEAKKKIDDRHYAVKRIPLPDREKSRDKVMREVKALAKLDHRNIVRYFNAWIENPPLGWLEKNDPLWNMCKIDASSANYFSSQEMLRTSIDRNSSLPRNPRALKKDYSEISMPNKTPVDFVEPEDSFIVFAADGESADSSCNSMTRGDRHKLDFTSSWELSGKNSKRKNVPILPLTISDSSFNNNTSVSDENSSRGFFVRPTSLDIPSSVDESSAQSPEEDEEDETVEEVSSIDPPSIMYLYIQQELCQKRTLQEWLRTTSDRNLQQVVQFFAQIVEAVEYIHSNKLIHRDLKPGNIFLASAGENELSTINYENMTVKIGDFGLATTAVNRVEIDTLTPMSENPPMKVNLTGHVGTHMYMSPEQSQNQPYDFKVDIYSLGLIFFELLVPFSTDMERHEVLVRVRQMKFPSDFRHEHAKEHTMIADMVAHNPAVRPSATEVKNWVKQHLQNILPSSPCSPSATRELSNVRSQSSDTPFYRYNKRSPLENDRLLNKTQSCM